MLFTELPAGVWRQTCFWTRYGPFYTLFHLLQFIIFKEIIFSNVSCSPLASLPFEMAFPRSQIYKPRLRELHKVQITYMAHILSWPGEQSVCNEKDKRIMSLKTSSIVLCELSEFDYRTSLMALSDSPTYLLNTSGPCGEQKSTTTKIRQDCSSFKHPFQL